MDVCALEVEEEEEEGTEESELEVVVPPEAVPDIGRMGKMETKKAKSSGKR